MMRSRLQPPLLRADGGSRTLIGLVLTRLPAPRALRG